jgi:hypothetical protein
MTCSPFGSVYFSNSILGISLDAGAAARGVGDFAGAAPTSASAAKRIGTDFVRFTATPFGRMERSIPTLFVGFIRRNAAAVIRRKDRLATLADRPLRRSQPARLKMNP